jgi:hypothetical protein
LLLVAFAFATASAADDGVEAKYRQAFYDNATATLARMAASNPAGAVHGADEQKTAQILTDCHMRVLGVYSPDLRDAAFAVIHDGGSYEQAKAAFNGAVAIEAAAGGEREAAVKRMFEKATAVGQECLKQLPANGG